MTPANPSPLGLLLVMMEPPAEHEEEFQAWYDTEHMPQRLSMPGFLSAQRWQCIEGWPRWLALYDLASPAAVETPEYLAVVGERSTPWTRRILAFAKGYRRVAAEQLEPNHAVAAPGIRQLVVAKLAAREDADAIRDSPGLIQLRIFECRSGPDAGPWLIAGFSGNAPSHPGWNTYVPYRAAHVNIL